MAKLVYAQLCSLDGYIADADGQFGWAAPDEEVHAFVNDLMRGVGTHLYGRRMYEVLQVWETWDTAGEPEPIRDYQELWRAADKIVYSRTLESVATPRTQLERAFDAGSVAALKASAERDLSIGGPELAAAALAAGLVDECHLVMAPVVVGGGTPVFPDGLRLGLRLVAERRFANGFVHVGYACEH